MILRNRVEERHDLVQNGGGVDHGVGHRAHLGRKFLHAIPLDSLCRVLDEIDAVIEHVRNAEDILPVNRRIERAVRSNEHRSCHGVGGLLDVTNPRDVVFDVSFFGDHLP